MRHLSSQMNYIQQRVTLQYDTHHQQSQKDKS